MNAPVPAPGLLDDTVWQGCIFDGSGIASQGAEIAVTDKASGAVLTRTGQGNAADIAAAAAAARSAQPAWAATPYEQRAAILRKAARLLERHQDEIIGWNSRETGGIAGKAGFEAHTVAGILDRAAAMPTDPQGLVLPSDPGRISMARRLPLGVVGIIAPFNAPFILSARAVAPALATGNAVVLKPDPQTPVSGGFVLARLFEEAGLPKGVLHVVPGGPDAGEQLCVDPNIAMVCFTGSTAIGRRVGELCGRHLKKAQLELGGKNAVIVLDDADLDKAASAIAFGAWFHQGQICMTTGRVIVDERSADALAARLVEKAKHLPVGNPTGQVALGPIINERAVQRIHAIVVETVEAGATLAAGGTHDGPFYRPTVLTAVKPGMRAYAEEVFGPVVTLTPFRTEDEAVALANDTEYGLSAGVFSASVGRALAIGNRLRTGLLHINDQTVGDEPWIPFGGMGASGNGTRIGGPANWEEFTQWQWVTIAAAPPPYPF